MGIWGKWKRTWKLLFRVQGLGVYRDSGKEAGNYDLGFRGGWQAPSRARGPPKPRSLWFLV